VTEQRFDLTPQFLVTRAGISEEHVAVLTLSCERQMVNIQELLTAAIGRHRSFSGPVCWSPASTRKTGGYCVARRSIDRA
jgi:hypothetical protein